MDLFNRTKKAKLVSAYRDVFSTDQGKEVLHDLCKACNIYHTTMDANPNEVIYKEGARSVILRILRTIEINPHELDRMLKNERE